VGRPLTRKSDVSLLARVGFTLDWARHRLLYSRRRFELDGRSYRYFWGRYHTTWLTERAVELAIAREAVRGHRADRVLEVGNVLSHYQCVRHAVVDKYERASGVMNRDVVDLRPERDYDLILSISTLEHVGWDEEEREPDKILRAVDALTACLSPTGTLLITLPVGLNPNVDSIVDDGRLGFTRWSCRRRVSADHRWVQADWREVRSAAYDHPFRCANGLVVGVIERPRPPAPR
jgi:hypothetical protein